MKNIYNSAKKVLHSKPRLQFILTCFVVAISVNMEAQVTVAGSTGANASYTTLKAAFDAINTNSNATSINHLQLNIEEMLNPSYNSIYFAFSITTKIYFVIRAFIIFF